MNLQDFEPLCRLITGNDFTGPVYIIDRTELPADFWPDDKAIGYQSPVLDLAACEELHRLNRWRGRGWSMAIDTGAIYAGLKKSFGSPSWVAEMFRIRTTAIVIHELAHSLDNPPSLAPADDRQIEYARLRLSKTVCREIEPDPETPMRLPWSMHGLRFIRCLLHAHFRAECELCESIPMLSMFDHEHYQIETPIWAYRQIFMPEIRHKPSFEWIRNSKPPREAVKQWASDLQEWSQTQPNAQDSFLRIVRELSQFAEVG